MWKHGRLQAVPHLTPRISPYIRHACKHNRLSAQFQLKNWKVPLFPPACSCMNGTSAA